MVRTERGPLRPVWALAHEALARGAAAYLRGGDSGTSAYVRGSLGTGEPIYGLSDVDLSSSAPTRGRRRALAPPAGPARALLDRPTSTARTSWRTVARPR